MKIMFVKTRANSLVQKVPENFSKVSLQARLLPAVTHLSGKHWLVALAMALIAGILRSTNLSNPDDLVFDETYYVKDAYSLLQHGYEVEWQDDTDEKFSSGDFSGIKNNEAEYVVHPPFGKWMIAFGMQLFGPASSFGWRFSAALIGTLGVALIVLIGIKMFNSSIFGGLAGLYMAVEGFNITQSRIGILDIFLMFFLLLAFLFFLLDRENGRKQLIKKLTSDGSPTPSQLKYGPIIFWRPWRFLAAISLGLSLGVKWSALAVIAGFCVMTILWDMNARRVAGIKHWFVGAILKDGIVGFFQIIPLVILTYLMTWLGWLNGGTAESGGYYRRWFENKVKDGGENPFPLLQGDIASLWAYHVEAYNFHNGLTEKHNYGSPAWQWPFLGRPTAYRFRSYSPNEDGCHVDEGKECVRAITNVANPILWWAVWLAVIILLILWFVRFGFTAYPWSHHLDWRAGAILCGVVAGYVPWLFYPERTMFFFYAVSFEPFLILALVFLFAQIAGTRKVYVPDGDILTTGRDSLVAPFKRLKNIGIYTPQNRTHQTAQSSSTKPGQSLETVIDNSLAVNISHSALKRWKAAWIGIAIFTIIVILVTAYFYPIWTAQMIPYDDWIQKMWLPDWWI